MVDRDDKAGDHAGSSTSNMRAVTSSARDDDASGDEKSRKRAREADGEDVAGGATSGDDWPSRSRDHDALDSASKCEWKQE